MLCVFKKNAVCIPKCLYHFAFPFTMYDNSSYSTFSTILSIVRFLAF